MEENVRKVDKQASRQTWKKRGRETEGVRGERIRERDRAGKQRETERGNRETQRGGKRMTER